MPLVKGLKEYIEEENAPFSMPGHKYGRAYCKLFDGIDLKTLLLSGDITEVEGLDNLHKPNGIIKEAQERLKFLYESKKSYFLINGSTAGNLIMIFSAFEEGDKVLIERNCHRSIFNGIIMRKLRPIYIKSIISEQLCAPVSLDKEHFLSLLAEHKDIKGIVLTYPNYYGIATDLEFIIRECKKKNIKVLVDAAHGAHFGFHPKLPQGAVKLGADIVVMSAHKTLPSLTQTSYLHLNNMELLEKLEFYYGVFQSTSPSYMLMASLDFARAFLEEKALHEYSKLFHKISEVRDEINKLDYIHVVDRKTLADEIEKFKIDIDESRIVLNLEAGLSGHLLLEKLREEKVQGEMSDERNVVLITTPFNTDKDYEKLISALKSINPSELEGSIPKCTQHNIPNMRLEPWKAVKMQKELIDIGKSESKICGNNIILYPPGIPLLMLGEKIEHNHIKIIKDALKNGITVIGIEEGKVSVIPNIDEQEI